MSGHDKFHYKLSDHGEAYEKRTGACQEASCEIALLDSISPQDAARDQKQWENESHDTHHTKHREEHVDPNIQQRRTIQSV